MNEFEPDTWRSQWLVEYRIICRSENADPDKEINIRVSYFDAVQRTDKSNSPESLIDELPGWNVSLRRILIRNADHG